MNKKLKLAVIAMCFSPAVMAQEVDSLAQSMQDEQTFTFTEAQLGEDDNVSQNITLISSNRNVYASEVGYRFSPARFKYRAFNSKYNDIYINGNPVNDVERGEFRYSFVGGLNNQTRSQESALPFEDNRFAMTGMAGSNNYNFRPSSFATGQRVSLAGANRNYTARAMYTYNSGVTEKGWAFTGSLTYRWANMETANIEGTFYNALSYFLGVEKLFGDHSLSLVTWGNPTERGAQAASTDEMYWIANNRYYNPNWGYQNGKKRNSRIINDFAPAALLTWDWKVDEDTKLVTSLLGKYSMYSSTRLQYNNSTNPAPDYYSTLPSYFYDVWAPYEGDRSDAAFSNWATAYDYLKASKANRQINWDRLYYANKMASAQGADAMYYQQAYHDDQLAFSLSSTLQKQLKKNQFLSAGINLSTNKGMHYQTMEDLLGATSFRNLNTFAIGTYAENSDEVRYDMNQPADTQIKEGDRFGYDYNIFVNKANAWATWSIDANQSHVFFSGRIGGTTMQRDGKMRNGLAPNNSFGKSETAKFLDGGAKFGIQHQIARGNMVTAGVGYELKAPQARNAFSAPQVNNDFTTNLKNEKVFSAEVGYQLTTSWLKANLNTFFSRLHDVSEYSMAYSDVQNSFSYISLTGISKEYVGAELGLNVKVSSDFNIKALATISDAKYTNNSKVRYMLSENGKYKDDVCLNKDMREGGTPLTATSIDLSYHAGGWFIDLIGNYYDRIYLYYSPITRYYGDFTEDGDGNKIIPEEDLKQAKGKGGFMLDASIGKSFRLSHGRTMSINLMLTNILNNTKIVTGGMEQNRRDKDEEGNTIRTYSFKDSPKKFYANGINGMLLITYKF